MTFKIRISVTLIYIENMLYRKFFFWGGGEGKGAVEVVLVDVTVEEGFV